MTPQRHVSWPFILPLSPHERRTNPVVVLSVVASRRPFHTGHRTGGSRPTTIVTGAGVRAPVPAGRALYGSCVGPVRGRQLVAAPHWPT